MPVDNIVGERSSTDFGMDFGGGVKFGAFYADLRYHYIWGPEVEEQNVSWRHPRHACCGGSKSQRPVPAGDVRHKVLSTN